MDGNAHEDLLPLWMSSEAAGGHTPRPFELVWDPKADTTSLCVFWAGHSMELWKKTRYFRSMVQWSVVWNRYAPAAVAMEQLTWPQALAHLDQMFINCEEERYCGNSPAVVFVYDELLRKSVANRAEWNDKSLDLAVVFENGTSKSWKLLGYAYCKPVWVAIPLVAC